MFSDIEQQLAIGFVWFVALLFTFGAGAAGLAILGDHYGRRLLGWWRRRQEGRKSSRIATATPRKGGEQYPYTLITPQAKSAPFADNGVRIVLMRPEVPEDQFDLLDVGEWTDHGWRCPQGMRVIHGGRR